jgi:hypothetical protein
LGRFFVFIYVPFPVSGGLSIAKFCPPAALSRSMAGGGNLAVDNPAESHTVHHLAL